MKRKIFILLLSVSLAFGGLGFNTQAQTVNESQQVANELGGVSVSEDSIPDNVIPLEFDSVEDAQEYLVVIDEMQSEGKALILSSADILENYDEEKNAVNMSTLDITEDDFVPAEEIESDDNDQHANLSASTAVKTQSICTGVAFINIYAKYTYGSGKFKSVKSVTSNHTGVTIGSEWYQDTYSSSITSSGKKLNVHVYGHFDYYILIKSSYTKVASSSADYKVSWDY